MTTHALLMSTGAGRRRRDIFMRGLLLAGTILALIPLFLVLFYVIKRGLGAWTTDFFTTDPTGAFLGDPGGVKSALLGTLEIVALASVIANEFGEAANTPIHSSALFAAGLVLFVLTLLVNVIARWFVNRGSRGRRGAGDAGLAVPAIGEAAI